jgi:hypothetical protein
MFLPRGDLKGGHICLASCTLLPIVVVLGCRNPTFGRVWGWHSHFRNGDLGVFRDSRNFRVRFQGSKHLALKRSSCHLKPIEV